MTALYAAWMASGRFSPWAWLLAWLAEAALAICIGLIAMWKKAEHAGVPLTSGPSHEFMFGFLPSATAGGYSNRCSISIGLRASANWLFSSKGRDRDGDRAGIRLAIRRGPEFPELDPLISDL